MTTDLPFSLTGSILLTGASNVGKTRLTAYALDAWIHQHGPQDVVIFDFGPEYEYEGQILGRRLSWFTDIPDETFQGILDAHAPRAESDTEAELLRLASENANGMKRCLASAPTDPTAVFVNDTTIGFQHALGEINHLIEYCDAAEMAILNAFESDEFGTDNPVSRQERATLNALKTWVDRTITLESG